MELTTDLQFALRQLIDGQASRTVEAPYGQQWIAAELDAIPVFCDLGGYLAIRSDGVVLEILDEPAADAKIVEDERIRNHALFEAAHRYPELCEIVPVRPPDATDCEECGGTGVHPVARYANFTAFVCYCGGLGWLPVGSLQQRDESPEHR